MKTETAVKLVWAVVVTLLVALIAVTVASACEGCPDGEVEVCKTEQVCKEVLVQPATSGRCASAPYYKHDGNSANCSLKNDWKWLRMFGYPQTIQGDWIPGQPAVYETQCKDIQSCDCVPEPTPEPQGEQCGRCSNVFEGYVEWYDRDGGCDGDYYNERVEYPGDERCVIPDDEPVPTPTPVPACVPTMYVLVGNGTCSLTINRAVGEPR